MSIMLDLIGSMIVRGAIMLTFLYLTINLQNALYEKTIYATVKQKTVIPAQILTDDLRMAGYGPSTSKTFSIAYLQEIQFSVELNVSDTYGASAAHSDPAPNVVHYYLGPATQPDSTHRILYRRVDTRTPFQAATDVDSLVFTYFDSLGVTISPGLNVQHIKSIKVRLVMQSNAQTTDIMTSGRAVKGLYGKNKGMDTTASAYKTHYVKAVWERTIFPQNL